MLQYYEILVNKYKSSSVFESNTSNFEDALISTAVVEAATRSLKNNSSWQKIKL